MKITQLFKNNDRTFSFEFFPPKDEISAVDFGINVGQLMHLDPSFVSVTYGAGGSNQERTFGLVDYLQNRIGLRTMAHYTCVGSDQEKVRRDMIVLRDLKIENLMLLRGDPPKGADGFMAPENGFGHANELISFVRGEFDFTVGAAAYPERHPESPNVESDIEMLLGKCKSGADFLITQFFFDNKVYFDFVKLARNVGITCRIIPGIIPVTNYKQIKRFADMTAATFPPELLEKLDANQDNPERVYQIGIDHAIRQCVDLLNSGSPGVHFYTLNKSRAVVEVFESLPRMVRE
jgi:methylenetetrahydrofolate reductase (NADPH)